MDIIGRLKGDPEEKPLDPTLVVPDEELETDEPGTDQGDADGAAEAGKKATKP